MTGRELPADWALDPAGRPVTDPGEAAGALLAPIGGYKGYGIALMIDLLTGGLGAGPVGTAVGSPYEFSRPQGVSHSTLSLDPVAFGGGAALEDAVRRLEREVRASPRQPGVDAIYLPGDPEWLRAEEARTRGIELTGDTLERLRALGEETGVAFPEAVS